MLKSKEDLLVLSAQQGNAIALAELYKFYYKPLLRYAYKVCANQHMAQDVTQDVWLEMSKKLIFLRDPRAFKSCLYKMVRWRCIDVIRKTEKNQTLNSDEFFFDPTELLQQQTDIQKAMLNLKPKEREVVYLFYLEDLGVREISQIIEVPIGTVKSRLSKARETLRNILL